MQNIENKMNNENINKPADPKEVEKLKKKRTLDRMFQDYAVRYRNSTYSIPPIIHYSQLLKEEQKKPKNEQGELFIQTAEYNIDDIITIQKKYNIKPNDIIVSNDNLNDAQFYEKYDIDKPEAETDSKSNQKEKKEEKQKVGVEEKKSTMMTATYKTILNSLKIYSGLIDKDHHHAVALSNISVTEYQNLKEKYNQVAGSQKDLYKKLAEIIINDMHEHKIINFKSITNSLLIPKIEKLFKSLLKLRKKPINGEILITDDFSLLIIIHTLVIHKSFWMLFPTKNHPFLVFIIERILEFTDKRLTDLEIIHIYNPKTDLASIKKSKSKDIESQKKKGKYNNKTIIKYILGEYFNYSSEQKKSFGGLSEIEKKKCESHADEILKKNNISDIGYEIFNSIPEKATDDEDTQPFKLKLYPNRQFYLDNSLSEKITKVSNDNFKQIFEFFSRAKNEEKAILLLSTGTKGLIQYLLVSGLYLIFKNDNVNKRIQSRMNASSKINSTNKTNKYKKMHIPKKNTFYGYLLDKSFDHPYTFIQMLTITFKNVISMEMDDFESDSKNVYEKFLKFAWEEYKIVRSFTKNF